LLRKRLANRISKTIRKGSILTTFIGKTEEEIRRHESFKLIEERIIRNEVVNVENKTVTLKITNVMLCNIDLGYTTFDSRIKK